jgi:HAMP domain-containing protein
MRSFQTKLVLPLVLLVLLIGAFMEFHWLPNWQQHEVEDRLTQEKVYLELLGTVLRNPILTSDMAAVYDVLDQLSLDRKHWQSLTLTRTDGLLLYPMTQPDQQFAATHWLAADVMFEDRTLAQLNLSLDLSPFLEAERDRLRMLELILLSVALLAAVVIGWMQRQLVLKPIDRISGTARQIAKGDFYSPIPAHPPQRGLQDFFHAFRVMRDSIAEKHEELSQQIVERENA